MTKECIEKELTKVWTQLETLQAKQKDLGEQKRMTKRAGKMDMIKRYKISSEKLQLLIKFSEDEILKLLEEKENVEEMAENKEEVTSQGSGTTAVIDIIVLYAHRGGYGEQREYGRRLYGGKQYRGGNRGKRRDRGQQRSGGKH